MLPKKYRQDHPPMLNQAASQRKAAPMKRLSLLALSLICGNTVSAAKTHHEASMRAMVKTYCLDCHDSSVTKGDLNVEAILADDTTQHIKIWEDVVRRLSARQMPPAGKKRPDEATYQSALKTLETTLDQHAMAHPQPGRTETIRRMNRTEYRNAIRDLLALEIDAVALLPADEASHGFDNVTVGTLSPTLLDRYLSAAQKISHLAVGGASRAPGGDTIRMKPDITQEEWVEGLPLGTRGGALIPYTFPRNGDYDVRIYLARDRDEEVEGLKENHNLIALLDGKQINSFEIKPASAAKQQHVDDHLKFRMSVNAGPHNLGITFLKNPSSLQETLRQPYNSHFNSHRHPRISPAVFQVSITGPYDSTEAGDSPSRKKIFIATPTSAADEEACAKKILSPIMRRAYRRPITDDDLARPLKFFREARTGGGFDAGIEAALSAILVSREFLFRVEQEPKTTPPGAVYQVSDIELASRLSYFLWSSIPDDELLAVAERGELSKPDVLEKQTQRLLSDPRSESLVYNFASQWLHLRNLESITPDGRLFPDFDDNLRQAMRQETEMLFSEIFHENRSVMDLLKADHTYLNERLAKHYGIPYIYGQHFRRVSLPKDSQRGGLLRHGSVLTLTSYATRTSPVIRGKWVLENIMGTPPPPPAPDVPGLDDNNVSASLPVRERLAAHRANPVCASCHDFMDPVGFSFENFDAVGRWRTMEEGQPVDATGGLPDGSTFHGIAGLEDGLLKRPEMFATALTEKLLVFALGRGVEYYDGIAVRTIVRHAQTNDFRFAAIIQGIVKSTPFRMRQKL